MQNKKFTLNYELMPHGTDKTELIFTKTCNEIYEEFWREFENEKELIIVTDSKIAELESVKPFLEKAKEKLIEIVTIQTGEENKTIESVLYILKNALKKSFSRQCTFLALGGGVISDMTAFAASLYKRGSHLQIIPTTLLSMADASIGGKTGCDFEQYKNMIGTFYPAQKIYFCSQFLVSLPEHEFLSGLGEIVKTALLYDKDLFTLLQNNKKQVLERDEKILDELIFKCANAKSKIVEQDITEKNIRKQLNLGHTFAHALESVAGFGVIPHGVAVGWGISRAIQLSKNLGLCDQNYLNSVFSVLEKYGYETNPLPKCLLNKKNVQNELICAMKQDKKNERNEIFFVLQKNLCETLIMKVAENEIFAVLDKNC